MFKLEDDDCQSVYKRRGEWRKNLITELAIIFITDYFAPSYFWVTYYFEKTSENGDKKAKVMP